MQCKELFIYSRFLTLVLNAKAKNNSLRLVHGSHLDGAALRLKWFAKENNEVVARSTASSFS